MAKKQLTSKTYTNPIDAYRAFWTRGFTEWAGTSSRSEYWWAYLVDFLILLILDISVVVGAVLLPIFAIATLIPGLSQKVRRLHDANRSAWHMLWGVFSFVAWIIFIAACDSMFMGAHPAGLIVAGISGFLGFGLWVVSLVLTLLPTVTKNNPYHKNNK